MYESPINIIISKLCTNLESDCVKSVQRYGFDVDKEELAKALNYDRKQYEKGHTDGYNKAIDDFAEKLNAKCDRMINEKWNSNIAPISWAEAYADFKDDIDEIKEELKAGEKNE